MVQRIDRGRGAAIRPQVVKELTIGDITIVGSALQSLLIGAERAVEFKEFLIPLGLREDVVPLRVRLTFDDPRVTMASRIS